MLKFTKKTAKTSGAAPGTLVHVGERKTDRTRISIVEYEIEKCDEREYESIDDAIQALEPSTTTWVNIDGIHDMGVIQKVGNHFNIHSLTLEDIVNSGQRPKVEAFDDYIYFVIKMIILDEDTAEVRSEQLSIILGDDYLISYQEVHGDVFESVRERLRKGRGRLRKSGTDYLAYALIDAVVDNYFVILEKIGMTIASIEEDLLTDSKPDTMQRIHEMKRELIYLRKQVWPIREMINSVTKQELPLVQENTVLFFRDVYDHTIQIIDTIESYRDLLSGMLDLYLSTVSYRMNEVMKVLTIIATIFIPITFVAGIYGMNFKFMPELQWRWGYLTAWGIIAFIVVIMLFFFKRKKWL